MRRVWAIANLLIKEIFRKKDFYVALFMTGFVLFYASRMQFYKVDNAFRYLLDIGMGLSALCAVVLTVCLASRQFPSEMQNRTCQVLLSKPVSRWQIITGKFLGTFMAGIACYAIFFGIMAAVACSKTSEISVVTAAQTFYLFSINILLLAALATFFSFLLTESANNAMTLLIYFMISVYGYGLKKFAAEGWAASRMISETVYYLIPHFEFFDMRQRLIHGWEPISLKLTFFLTLYGLSYGAIFLLAAWLVFRRKPIA